MRAAYLLPLLWACAAAGAAMVIACGPDSAIGLPAGANNFDDPDDPGQSGQNSTGADSGGDANGRFCTGARDCPAAFVCAYPVADLCGAAGRCLQFDTTTCADAGVACGCDNTAVTMCAPPGYAPKPIASTDPCVVVDSGSDAVAPSDASSDAAAD